MADRKMVVTRWEDGRTTVIGTFTWQRAFDIAKADAGPDASFESFAPRDPAGRHMRYCGEGRTVYLIPA